MFKGEHQNEVKPLRILIKKNHRHFIIYCVKLLRNFHHN